MTQANPILGPFPLTRFSLTRSQAFLTLFSSSGSCLLLTGGERLLGSPEAAATCSWRARAAAAAPATPAADVDAAEVDCWRAAAAEEVECDAATKAGGVEIRWALLKAESEQGENIKRHTHLLN